MNIDPESRRRAAFRISGSPHIPEPLVKGSQIRVGDTLMYDGFEAVVLKIHKRDSIADSMHKKWRCEAPKAIGFHRDSYGGWRQMIWFESSDSREKANDVRLKTRKTFAIDPL